jgi:hypothetical protein
MLDSGRQNRQICYPWLPTAFIPILASAFGTVIFDRLPGVKV